MKSLLVFLPSEAAPLIIAAAGIALIVGARRIAAGLFMLGLAIVVLPVVLEPLFAELPSWLLYLLLLALGLAALWALLTLPLKAMLGQRAWDHMVGILAADAVRSGIGGFLRGLMWVLGLPFRILARLLRQR